ncbi:MAG: ATP-binding cassette domain-containing protein, partial [Myxococcales bacterium]|nr:ATP-binding cassette domain-containing protein [Myxococcales bacterium]
DEPSIGLHQRDNRRLIATLERLRDNGNTVVVVEHDEETIEHADHVLDFGPGAGRNGGHVVYAGDVDGLRRHADSLTGRYLSGNLAIEVPSKRRKPAGMLAIRGARENNLKGIDVEIPVGVMVVFSGVSGAGKSSLVRNILYPAVANHLDKSESHRKTGDFDAIDGLDQLRRVINIDQKPIGRTPRSNPATYTKVFDHIRQVFAQTPEARTFGYAPGRFSFNVKGGRCENCAGEGLIQIEMHFLADVYVPCEVCRGHRYNDATLKVRFKGKNISDVLEMTVDEVAELFGSHPAITRILETLQDVGLGYMPLGQSSTTLSGGEAQRIKLSRELAKRSSGDTLYILDEPTTGLHFEDVRKLLMVLQRLVDAGNTVVLIEHNLDVVKCADFVIDLGPEGGDRGGELVAEGTPEQLAADPRSYTGRYLRPVLDAAKAKRRKSR